MTMFLPVGYDTEQTDAGRTRTLIHCLIDGQKRTMTRGDYFKLVELMLPKGPFPNIDELTEPKRKVSLGGTNGEYVESVHQ